MCSKGGGKVPCSCDWHVKPQRKDTATADDCIYLKYGNVIELLLPAHASQSGLVGYGIGTNSCTAISVLACVATIQESLLSSNVIANPDELVSRYCGVIADGNMLYENIDPSADTPNLMVKDVIEQSDVEVYLPQPMIAILDADQLASRLITLSKLSQIVTCVLIVSPDKAMALCIVRGSIWAFDSHRHLERGALIAFAGVRYIHEFCHYLALVCERYFGSGVNGSNLIHLEQFTRSL